MSTANQITESKVSFSTDITLVTALLKDLQDEQAALIAADMDAIEVMIDHRMELLQSLGAAARQRYDALAAHGFEASEKGMSDWLEQQSDAEMQKEWLAFQAQLIQAKEMNRVNGLLIGKHFQRNQERLDTLQGKGAQPQIYGKNGQTLGMQNHRSGMAV